MKVGLQSVTMDLGMLWSFKILSMKTSCSMEALNGCCKAQKLAYLEGQLTTTMITDLLPDFNNPIMRSIEMSTLMVALTGEGCNAPRGFTISPLCH